MWWKQVLRVKTRTDTGRRDGYCLPNHQMLCHIEVMEEYSYNVPAWFSAQAGMTMTLIFFN